MVRYRCDRFYDPIRREHRQVSFGFFSYSLPLDAKSSRVWRFAWDPIFFELTQPVGGHLRFDLELYRELDEASRRLFLLLQKIFARRSETPRFDLRWLAVNTLGFSDSMTTRDLKVRVNRVLARLSQCGVVADDGRMYERTGKGRYRIQLRRGPYFDKRVVSDDTQSTDVSALHDSLVRLGLDAAAAVRMIRQYPTGTLREWADITMAAQERFGPKYFKRCPAAFFVDNVKHAARNERTPPDWWHELRKEELRQEAESQRRKRSAETKDRSTDLAMTAEDSYHELMNQMFGHFLAAGQSEELARRNAEKCARIRNA
jgi:hypothetical protein